MAYCVTKEKASIFLKDLSSKVTLYAPVKRKLVMYEKITDPASIYLATNAYFPLKQFFFKQKSTLFSYKQGTVLQTETQVEPKVFFGVRRCDLAAIKHQDMVFLEQYHDPHYAAERAASILIGYHCPTAPSPYCFCGSMRLPDFYDLMFFDRGDSYLIDIGSEKGKALISDYQQYFDSTTQSIAPEDKVIPNSDRLHKLDISNVYDHPDWKKGVNDCLSCGACTALCPTCYCFEVHDEPGLQKGEGKRTKSWSSCQLQDFTQVAGGHVFRTDREQRFKHRIYHQLEYFKKKNGINLCTGCGRCISGCPTRIDFVDIINNMK